MNKQSFLTLLFVLVCSISFSQEIVSVKKYSQQRTAMGSSFTISVIGNDEDGAQKAIGAGFEEIDRIEKLISSWDPTSQTSEINRQAGISPVKVDKELLELIYRSLKVSRLTNGAFDVSYASMDHIWKFDGSLKEMPTREEIVQSVQFVNYENVEVDLNNQTVFLKEKGMKIGFGGIGKGYAANRAKEVILKLGFENGIVNAGGDLTAWGKDEHGEFWGIAIADPSQENKVAAWLNIENTAVVTSGDYERYVEFEGRRYSHIIDPKTGYPTTGIKSVTIICPNAELADAMATAIFVLGTDDGLELINQMDGLECLIITDVNELLTSSNMDLNHQ